MREAMLRAKAGYPGAPAAWVVPPAFCADDVLRRNRLRRLVEAQREAALRGSP